MRILIACSYSWDSPGGVQVHIKDLANWLMEKGHKVLVLAPGDKTIEHEKWVQIVGKPVKVTYRGTVAPISSTSLNPVRLAIKKFKPDVIHAHEPFVPSCAMFAVLSAGKTPVVATFHAFTEDSKLLKYSYAIVKPILKMIDIKLAVSKAAANYVSIPMKTHIRIIPNGVDVEAFSMAKPKLNLPEYRKMLWVNRLDKQKGFDVAIRAFDKLADKYEDLIFVVAGDGKDKNEITKLVSAKQKRVMMLGSMPHEKLPSIYASSDVFISPAIGQESFGIVLIEAMAAGVPVVSTNIAGYKEVMDPKCGYLVNPNDANALSNAVSKILDDPKLANDMSIEGKKHSLIYSWDNVGSRLESIYKEAVDNHYTRAKMNLGRIGRKK